MKALPLLIAVLAIGCTGNRERQVAGVKSNDGRVRAILVEVITPATVAKQYIVRLEAGNAQSDILVKLDKVTMSANNDVPILLWTHADRLDIRYEKAHVWQFTNFWNSRELENFNRTIELRLAPSKVRSVPER